MKISWSECSWTHPLSTCFDVNVKPFKGRSSDTITESTHWSGPTHVHLTLRSLTSRLENSEKSQMWSTDVVDGSASDIWNEYDQVACSSVATNLICELVSADVSNAGCRVSQSSFPWVWTNSRDEETDWQLFQCYSFGFNVVVIGLLNRFVIFFYFSNRCIAFSPQILGKMNALSTTHQVIFYVALHFYLSVFCPDLGTSKHNWRRTLCLVNDLNHAGLGSVQPLPDLLLKDKSQKNWLMQLPLQLTEAHSPWPRNRVS